MNTKLARSFLDTIEKPILTDKSTKLLEDNQYSFIVTIGSTKDQIKQAIEYIFNVQVRQVHTLNLPVKKRRVGKFVGKRGKQKKAIVTLASDNTINLFAEELTT